MRIAIEATSLAQDRRGIGRYARRVLQHLARLEPSLEFLFLTQAATLDATRNAVAELGLEGIPPIVDLVDRADRRAWDLFWCPWSYTRHWPSRGPVAVTLHDVTPFCFPDQLPVNLVPRLKRKYRYLRSGRRADLILTDSEFSRSEIIRVLGAKPERITVALLGCDEFSPGDRGAAQAAAARRGVLRPFLLYVGGHEVRKNLVRMLRAFELLRSRGGSACDLVMAGPVPCPPPEVQQVIESSLYGGAIHYLANVDDAELQALYRAATALVYPSVYEGFGLPVLEAMASGCPVLSSAAPSLPEVGGNAPLYFNPLEVEDIAHAMSMVVSNPVLQDTMRDRGLKQAALLPWEQTARVTLQALKRATSGNRLGRLEARLEVAVTERSRVGNGAATAGMRR